MRSLHEYPERSLKGLAKCATNNIAAYVMGPLRFDSPEAHAHICYNIGNRARLLRELRRRRITPTRQESAS